MFMKIFLFFLAKYWNTTNVGEKKWNQHFVLKYNLNWFIKEISQHCLHNAWCWLYGFGGGFGILGSWVQIPLDCWIHTRWGWLCLSSFWGQQNECQHAGILCRSGDPSTIGPNSQGDCLGSTVPTFCIEYGPDGWMDCLHYPPPHWNWLIVNSFSPQDRPEPLFPNWNQRKNSSSCKL